MHHKIDVCEALLGGNLTSATFNPVYPLVAVTLYEKLYVLAYGGDVRRSRGQLLFTLNLEHPLIRFRSVNWSPSGNYLLCLEEEKELQYFSKNLDRIKIIFYNNLSFEMHEIEFANELIPFAAMNTKFLWLDSSSFIFATATKHLFKIIHLKENNSYSEVTIDLTQSLDTLTKSNFARTKYVSFVSSLFVLPDPSSPYLFFLSSCPGNHQHHRLIFVDKLTQKIVKIANLPGEVVEISVTFDRYFLILQNRNYETYEHNAPSMLTIRTPSDLKECYFSEPFLCKSKSSHERALADGKIFSGDSDCIFPFRSPCCNTIPNMTCNLSMSMNLSLEHLFPHLTRISSGNSLFATKEYVYRVSKSQRKTRVWGLHHHFEFTTRLKTDYLFGPQEYVVYFHPSKPIFLRKEHDKFFDLYLSGWATDNDKTEFPEIDEDTINVPYNEKVSFKPV